MGETQGTTGYNTEVWIYYNSAWLQVSEPKDISGPSITQEKVEMTHMQSPSGYREYATTYKSAGAVTFRKNYLHNDASDKALFAIATANPTPKTYCRLKYPDSSQVEFNSYIGVAMNTPQAGPNEMTVTMDVTGNLVWQGAGSPSASRSASASASAS